MKKTALFLLVATCFQSFCLQLQQSFAQSRQDSVATEITDSSAYFRQAAERPRRKDYSAQIEALLRKMTIEEKVGQMTQLEIGQVTSGMDSSLRIDPAKLEKAIVEYKVGSILNVNNHALPVEKWWDIIGAIQTASARTRLKIPNIYGIDSIHGANYVRGATLFPQEFGMAAT
jgi:beta-glucosidase